MFANMKLKSKILITNVTIVVLMILVIFIISNNMFQLYFVEETENAMKREQQMILNSIDTIAESAEDYLRVISLDFRLQNALSILKENISTQNETIHYMNISNIMGEIISNIIYPATSIVGGAITADGEVVYVGYSILKEEAKKIITPEFIEKLEQSTKPSWTDLSPLTYTHNEIKNVIPVGKKIIDKDTGTDLGECILFVDERVINKSFNNRENRGDVIILDEDNNIISCSHVDSIGMSITAISWLDYIRIDDINNEGFYTNDKWMTYSVKDYEKNNWKIIIVGSYKDIYIKNFKNISLIVLIGCVCIILIFLFSHMTALTIIKPINKMKNKMLQAGNGDLSVRANSHYSGEMKIIAKSFNELMDKLQKYISEIYIYEQEKNDLEFKILQSQINPHFLYNTIETIISFITLDMKNEAKTTAMSLANFYKLSLNKGNSIISIGLEVELSKNYINIQNLRYGDYVEFFIKIDDIMNYSIPKLTLQPMIENALYHGIKECNHKGTITISGYEKGDDIFIEILDNGIGIDEKNLQSLLSKPNESGSFGLANVNSRLKIRYGNNYGLRIESEKHKYTKIVIHIPKDIE